MLIGARDRWVLVDCGIQFPENTTIGAERILPDVGFLERWRDKIEAVVITHGHEDHIGALPWALPALDPATPVYASDFTTALIRHRLTEHNAWDPKRMRSMKVGERIQAGPFEVEPIRVTHSLPDCASLVLRSEVGTIIHTGDWKIDRQPVDGEHFDFEAFERVGNEGVHLLLSDSTNILTPGHTLSETEVRGHLEARVAAWPGRVVVTQFASNLHRLASVGAIAQATGRKLVLCGRSLSRYVEAAQSVGRRILDPTILVSQDRLGDLKPSETLVVTTGSQGESRAALNVASEGAHRHLKLGSGDLVLHSARIIPGNEDGVYNMYNRLSMRGCEIVSGKGTGIHASGHARQDELAELIRLTKPGHFVPVHGEFTFLKAHAQLGRDLNLPGVTLLKNGERFGVKTSKKGPGRVRAAECIGMEELATLYNDGPATGDADEMLLTERKKIAWNGVVVVDLELTRRPDDTLTATANIQTRALWLDHEALPAAMERAAIRTVKSLPARTPLKEVEAAVQVAIRRTARKATGKRPDVLIVSHHSEASTAVTGSTANVNPSKHGAAA